MLIDINQPIDMNFNADFFTNFTVQGGKDGFPVVDLPARHQPLAAERLNTAAG